MKSPVLLLVFNRPDFTRRVFDRIRAAKPPKLYIAADGPRADRSEEAQRCQDVRSITDSIDWPCETRTLFRSQNLGCKMGVSSGITWFFDNEPEGIILEDDVLPVGSFFEYCDELLARYRDDDRIGAISGCNLVSHLFSPNESYFFSRYNHIWGWATWRRAWRNYDVTMKGWPAWRDSNGLARMPGATRFFQSYWRNIFDATYEGKIDTWDYQWTFACWRLGRLTALPEFNQTDNMGFGVDATHTVVAAPEYVHASKARAFHFPMRHPTVVAQELKADSVIDSAIFGITMFKALKRLALANPHLRSAIGALKRLVKN